MGALGILFLFILIIIFILMLDLGYIYLSKNCIGQEPIECALDMLSSSEEEEAPSKEAVTASGSISGEFQGEMRSVSVTLTFPLGGGAVSGSFSGDCDGSIKGDYAGGDGGAISGKGSGSCGFVLPASGNFSGVVNTVSKTVPISGKGSAAGFSGEGSLTLTY